MALYCHFCHTHTHIYLILSETNKKTKGDMEDLRREVGTLKIKCDLDSKEMNSLRNKQGQLRKKIVTADQEVVNKTTQYETLLHTLKEEKKKHHAESK